MANRLNLGGWYVSKGEKAKGDLRARFYLEYSNALANKISEIFMNHPDEFDSPRDVLSAIVRGDDYDGDADIVSYLENANEVNPDSYDREEWLEENAPEAAETAEADD